VIKYKLTGDCFKELIMMHKRIGRAARLYFLLCEKVTRDVLLQAAQNKGQNTVESSGPKRLKACESVKTMGEQVRINNPEMSGHEYAILHGMTNKACTSKTKGEWAREWGVVARSMNLRDHMTPVGLSSVDTLQMATAEALRQNPEKDPMEVHSAKCAAMATLMDGLETVTRKRQKTVKAARAESAARTKAIADTAVPAIVAGPTANVDCGGVNGGAGTINTINNYFQCKHASDHAVGNPMEE
jgi:hypothetical protein